MLALLALVNTGVTSPISDTVTVKLRVATKVLPASVAETTN